MSFVDPQLEKLIRGGGFTGASTETSGAPAKAAAATQPNLASSSGLLPPPPPPSDSGGGGGKGGLGSILGIVADVVGAATGQFWIPAVVNGAVGAENGGLKGAVVGAGGSLLGSGIGSALGHVGAGLGGAAETALKGGASIGDNVAKVAGDLGGSIGGSVGTTLPGVVVQGAEKGATEAVKAGIGLGGAASTAAVAGDNPNKGAPQNVAKPSLGTEIGKLAGEFGADKAVGALGAALSPKPGAPTPAAQPLNKGAPGASAGGGAGGAGGLAIDPSGPPKIFPWQA